jgi:phage-related minor tail protein
MTQLGEAFVPIRATLDKLDDDLNQARGLIDGALGGIGEGLQKLGGLALGGIVTGITAVGVGLAALGGFAFDAGMQVDNAMDSIVIATGATGAELDELQASFATVFSEVPTSTETASGVIGALNARLGVTGDALDDLAVPLAQVTELIGGDAVTRTELFTRVMGDWGVAVEDGASTLDTFFVASQETGAGMDDLMAKVVQFGSPLRLMGFGLEESIALFAQWEAQGVNAELVMGSLRIAAGEFANANIPLRDGLMQTMEAIQNAGSESEALSIAMETFGARAGPDMAAAILEGRFAIDDLVAAMENSEGAIMDTAAQTADFGEMFTLLKNKATLALAPIGAMMIDLANQVMPLVEGAFAWFEETLLPVIEEVAGAFSNFFEGALSGEDIFGDLANLVWELASIFGATEEQALGLFNAVVSLRDTIPALIDNIRNALAPIIEAIGSFVSWKDVLAALGVAIAAVVIPAIGSLLATIAPVLLVGAALVAGFALVRNAWENDWGGIQTKLTEVWEGSIRPALETLRDWLQVHVPIALEALRTFWVDVAWPAIVGAAQWFQENVIPILQNIWDWLSINVPAALETLRAFWVETAWPAIQNAIATVWPIIEHIFTTLRDWVVNTLIPTIQELYQKWTTEWWPQIQAALENAWTIIEEIFGEIGRWINTNIVPWIEFLAEKWGIGFQAVQAKLEEVWDVIEPIWIALVEWLEEKIPVALEALQPIFEGVMSGIKAAVQPVKDLWDAFVSAVESFWNWITSHEFSFDISIPDLPDWAVPGSPLPIHTAWRDFANFIRNTDMQLAVNVPDLGGEMATEAAAPADGGDGRKNEWHLHLPNATNTPDMMRGFSLLKGLVGVD